VITLDMLARWQKEKSNLTLCLLLFWASFYREYTNEAQVVADVHLTFNNAIKFNPEGSMVHAVAKKLLKTFDAELAKKSPAPKPKKPAASASNEPKKKKVWPCFHFFLGFQNRKSITWTEELIEKIIGQNRRDSNDSNHHREAAQNQQAVSRSFFL